MKWPACIYIHDNSKKTQAMCGKFAAKQWNFPWSDI